MRSSITTFLATLAVALAATAAACGQNPLPPLPPLSCPPGTSPSVTQVGGGGIDLGRLGTLTLPGYSSFDCKPVPPPAPPPAADPTRK